MRDRECFTAKGQPKLRFETRGLARAYNRVKAETVEDWEDLRPYRCGCCGYFHLGHYPSDERNRARLRARHSST